MAKKHQIALEIPDISNPCLLRIQDLSVYDDGIDVTCCYLEVTPPGFTSPTILEISGVSSTSPRWHHVYNACTIGIISSGCDENSPEIPDGIYRIRYSVAPNDKVFAEYLHLRVTQTLIVWNEELVKLDLPTYELSSVLKAKLDELLLIKSYIQAAKVYVEDKHDCERGSELFTYARKRLHKYKNKCKNC